MEKCMEKLLKIEFNRKPVYDDDENTLKQKWKHTVIVLLQFFIIKKCQKKTHHARVYQ